MKIHHVLLLLSIGCLLIHLSTPVRLQLINPPAAIIEPDLIKSFPEKPFGRPGSSGYIIFVTGQEIGSRWGVGVKDWTKSQILTPRLDPRTIIPPHGYFWGPPEWDVFLLQFPLNSIFFLNISSLRLYIATNGGAIRGRIAFVNCSLIAYPLIDEDNFGFIWKRRVDLVELNRELSGTDWIDVDLGPRAVELINTQLRNGHYWFVLAWYPIHLYNTPAASVYGHSAIYGPASGKGPRLLLWGDPMPVPQATKTTEARTITIYTTEMISIPLAQTQTQRDDVFLIAALVFGLGSALAWPRTRTR